MDVLGESGLGENREKEWQAVGKGQKCKGREGNTGRKEEKIEEGRVQRKGRIR